MKIVGITGSIGSGKSTVSEYLKKQGFALIDADKIAKSVLDNREDVKKELVEAFGDIIVSKISENNMEIDRKILRTIAFSKKESKEKLDSIMHKHVIKEMEEKIKELEEKNKKTVFLDVPLLFETGLNERCDDVWVVFTKKSVKITRVKARDEVSAENVENILGNQLSYREQVQLATYILDNNHSKEHLYAQIDKILEVSKIALEPKMITKGIARGKVTKLTKSKLKK